MSDNIQQRIRSRIDAFVEELNGLVRNAALEGVKVALGAGRPVAGPSRGTPAPAGRGGRRKGEKRSPRELAALVQRVGAWVKAHPGQGVEAIGRALGRPTKDLTLPLKKLIADKRIRSSGVKRATKYHPRGK